MKFVIVFAFVVMVGAAVVDQRSIAETLLKQAEDLYSKTNTRLYGIRLANFGHLGTQLEHQLVLLESLIGDLKIQFSDKAFSIESHHIHVIEEELLHLENTISEEVSHIDTVKDTHLHRGDTGAVLVSKSEALAKKAKDFLTTHKAAKEASAIEHEIENVEKLIKSLQAVPRPLGSDLKRDEQQLARHERTLEGLIAKATARGAAA